MSTPRNMQPIATAAMRSLFDCCFMQPFEQDPPAVGGAAYDRNAYLKLSLHVVCGIDLDPSGVGVMSDGQRVLIRAIGMLGMRAQATAVGLVQLCLELQAAKVLDEAALGRIKEVIVDELAEHSPRSMTKQAFRSNLHERLDKVFAGHERVGQIAELDERATS